MSIQKLAIIGLGLLGGSVGLATQSHAPDIATKGYDRDPDVRAKAAARGLVGEVCDTIEEAVRDADLVVLCVPVGAMEAAASELKPHLKAGAIISDVGSSKECIRVGHRKHVRPFPLLSSFVSVAVGFPTKYN